MNDVEILLACDMEAAAEFVEWLRNQGVCCRGR